MPWNSNDCCVASTGSALVNNDIPQEKTPSLAEITMRSSELLDKSIVLCADILKSLTSEGEIPKVFEPACLTDALLSNTDRAGYICTMLERIRYIIGGNGV